MKVILTTLAMFFFSLTSEACTMCSSKQATEVRALVFGDDFYNNLLSSVLPFVVFTGIIVFIYKGGKTIKT
ncbi:hypothetical protein SAMN05444008_101148 [Cnuella takakiae]|uniref:Uncharacterized protein n=1 Tax=Cnuella takakiae TaxID=1302690 RepID=A0A1M4SJJ0_9BACT|nr:hypothetical protein [Cnuella takakiae]OLY94525.1 hypothetical protein BUE76_23615 [Cnuella takakiae]SHE32403.1 hypothetical protein SAMN05444008_101148 [Cnuella takakiae]